ncbi:hypothetical protein LPJ53_003222 [Coemansia erecta]|uniref:Beta-catenin-like protein 1 N-terminal domain-containing protein n=1 Tax=Coemansia erecta TaxID=147472 RepID=A0A9W7XWP1_9FUNG|nr:hypothetical protein LPJ53_003222 [Coemansia erecta]
MNIDDIFTERVAGTAAGGSGSGGGRGKRKILAAPSLSELRAHGYAPTGESTAAEPEDLPASKRPHTSPDSPTGSDTEGGRFFSDGLTQREKHVLTWVDQVDDEEEEDGEGRDPTDPADANKLIARVQRAMARNTEQRVRHADAPAQFAASEADLDAAVRGLLPLASTPQGCAALSQPASLALLTGLLAHANADIAHDVVELVHEATVDSEVDTGPLVAALAGADFFDALGANLRRLDDAEAEEGDGYSEDDDACTTRTLEIVDALAGRQTAAAAEQDAVAGYARAMRLVEWLLGRLAAPTAARRLQAAEALADLLHKAAGVRRLALDAQAADRILTCLAASHANDGSGNDDDPELLENCADALCALLHDAPGKLALARCHGGARLAQLGTLNAHTRLLACKVLAHALAPSESAGAQGEEGGGEEGEREARREIAHAFVDEGGAKVLGYALLRRGATRALLRDHPGADERTVSCVALALLALLASGGRQSPAHWRVLAKFVPAVQGGDAWKRHVDRLVELNVLYAERAASAGDNDGDEEEEVDLVAALHARQMADVALAFVALADGRTRERIERSLRRKARSLDDVARELDGSADATVGAADLERLLAQL